MDAKRLPTVGTDFPGDDGSYPARASSKPRLGVSSCLLGQEVRFDGAHKRDRFLERILGDYVEWVSVCPEVDVGMGIPREAVRLVRVDGGIQMLGTRSRSNWTESMASYSREKAAELAHHDLSGYILKSNSPSCGAFRVKIYPDGDGAPSKEGRGLFADALMEAHPHLPVEEEGRLNDPGLRENFILRVYCYQRWRAGPWRHPTPASLVAFHTSMKMLLLAHSPQEYRALGRIVAEAGAGSLPELVESYEGGLMRALAKPASRGAHVNALQHIMGFVKDRLSRDEKENLLAVVEQYRRGVVPLVTPLTLLRHHLYRADHPWVNSQLYLDPYPAELGLRSAV